VPKDMYIVQWSQVFFVEKTQIKRGSMSNYDRPARHKKNYLLIPSVSDTML